MNPIKGILFSFTGEELRQAFLFQSRQCEARAEQCGATIVAYLERKASADVPFRRHYPESVINSEKHEQSAALQEAKLAVFMAAHIVAENTYLLDISEFKEMGFTNPAQLAALAGGVESCS